MSAPSATSPAAPHSRRSGGQATRDRPRRPGFAAGCLAFLLGLLVVLVLPLSLLLFNLGGALFSQARIEPVLTQIAVESAFIPAGLEAFSRSWVPYRSRQAGLPTGQAGIDLNLLLSFLDQPAWERISVEVLPREFLIGWVNEALRAWYGWLDSPAPLPEGALSLNLLKARLRSEHGAAALQIVYEHLPPCQASDIEDLQARQAAAPGTDIAYNLCAFPDPWQADQLADYRAAVTQVADSLPDQLTVSEVLDLARIHKPFFTALKPYLLALRTALAWAWALPLALALLIAALAVRSLDTLDAWLARPLLLGSGLALSLPLLTSALVVMFLPRPPLVDIPLAFRLEAAQAGLRLLRPAFQPMLVQALTLAGLALLLLIANTVARARSPASPALLTAAPAEPQATH